MPPLLSFEERETPAIPAPEKGKVTTLPKTKTMAKTKLLIAEDDGFFEKILQEVLGKAYELVITRNGNDAWDELRSPGAPRLAILDWVMPGLTGPEVCRNVRACPTLAPIYLILLTAKNNEPDIVAGLRCGADDYITKPPLPAELRARVRIGERVLALQETVEAQSRLANHESLWSVSPNAGSSLRGLAQEIDNGADAGMQTQDQIEAQRFSETGLTLTNGAGIVREGGHR